MVLPRPPQPVFRDAFYLDRLAQIAMIDLGGRALAVANLHLEAFDTSTREKQAEKVRALYDTLVAQNVPTLVIGDMNSDRPVASAGTSQTGVDETMRTLLDDTALRPTFPDSTYQSGSPPATYPADAPDRKIDYILYSPDRFVQVSRRIDCAAPSPPSDHCAVTASLRLRPSAANWPTPNDFPPLDSLLAD